MLSHRSIVVWVGGTLVAGALVFSLFTKILCTGKSKKNCNESSTNDSGCCGDCDCLTTATDGDSYAKDALAQDVYTCGASNIENLGVPTATLDSSALADRFGLLNGLSTSLDGNITIYPEDFSVYVKTYGCTHNTSDSEIMKGLLVQAGFKVIEREEDADLLVVNSCTVKNPSQDSAVNLAVKATNRGQRVIFAGCVTQADSGIKELANLSTVGVKNLDEIVEAAYATLSGCRYTSVDMNRDMPSLALPRVRKNNLIEIIPISAGCLGSCTYCKTRFGRGVLVSYPLESILARVTCAVNEGCQQIWITSEDTGAWGLDIGLNIVDLLDAVDNELERLHSIQPHNLMVRVGMTNPPYMISHVDHVAEIISRRHWFKFLHIPVQSGSDTVLAAMQREYTVADFETCVTTLRKRVPNITIAVDFICGFPGETVEDHSQSLALILKHEFPIVNISQFYARKGTAAASMKRLNSAHVKKRSTEMTSVFISYECNNSLLQQTKKVWIESLSEKSPHFVGHTEEYIKVLLDIDTLGVTIGSVIMCVIDSCSKWHVNGTFVGFVE